MTSSQNQHQDQQLNPQWNNYNWNHMALPTFGFIFAVPEPPSDLRIPQAPFPVTLDVNSEIGPESGRVEDESDASQHSLAVSRLQSRRQRKTQKSDSDKRLQQSFQPHTTPILPLQGGNSDPFSASAIPITPQINRILTFARDTCLPAFYFVDSLRASSVPTESNRDVTNSSGWISSPAARMGWQQVVDALSDKCTAMACLSTYLALMATSNINPVRATEASLKMRAGSSVLLRKRLLHHESQPPDIDTQQELLWQVFWHFYAEFFAGNMAAAQMHGRMLRQCCESAEEGVISDHFLDSVIFVDSHMAAKYMAPPVLDVVHWVPDRFAPNWDKVDPHVAEITGETGERIHPLIEACLRPMFIRTRQSLLLLPQHEEVKSYDLDFGTIYYWLNSHSYVDSGSLINIYLSLVETAEKISSHSLSTGNTTKPAQSLGIIYTHAALCVAALFAIRDIGQEVRINGIDVVDASTTIMGHLQQTLEKAIFHCTAEEVTSHGAAHLWCAFTGALIEQRHVLPTEPTHQTPPPNQSRRKPEPQRRPNAETLVDARPTQATHLTSQDPSTLPLNRLLAKLAHRMGLVSWQQVSDILRCFIYTDFSEPHGSRWFWKTMGAYLDQKRQSAREEKENRRQEAVDTESRPYPFREPPLPESAESRRRSIASSSGISSGRSTPSGSMQPNVPPERRRSMMPRTLSQSRWTAASRQRHQHEQQQEQSGHG